jgi:hypothetical protein
MPRRHFSTVVMRIFDLLQRKQNLSIRQISIKTKTQWRTAEKALDLLVYLKVVKEIKGSSTKREERKFSTY